MKWLIEDGIWDDYEVEYLTNALKKSCINYEFVLKEHSFHPKTYLFSNELCFCYGSIRWIKFIQYLDLSHLLTIANLNQFKCSSYYPYFSEFLFNNKYEVFSLRDFVKKVNGLLEEKGSFFVRPDTGEKPNGICGCVVNEQNIDILLSELIYGLNSNDLLLVCPKKNIDFEYRCVVSDNKFVTGCQYMRFDYSTKRLGVDPIPVVPDSIIEYVNNVCKQVSSWKGDDIYIMDVVSYRNEISILELNCLSTSGLYECEFNKVIGLLC